MIRNASQFDQIEMFEIKRCLIIPIQIDLYDEFIVQLKKKILEHLSRAPIVGVILDISTIKIIDSINLKSLIKLCKMIELMGKKPIITGFQPSVAAALTEFPELQLNKLTTFINLESSINYLINMPTKL